jgi:hypothetical protein
MKKLKAFLHACETRIEARWQKLSDRKQRRFVALFFGGYLLITGCVILTVWYDAMEDAKSRKNQIEHIRIPILQSEKQFGDSSSILKSKEHERK